MHRQILRDLPTSPQLLILALLKFKFNNRSANRQPHLGHCKPLSDAVSAPYTEWEKMRFLGNKIRMRPSVRIPLGRVWVYFGIHVEVLDKNRHISLNIINKVS